MINFHKKRENMATLAEQILHDLKELPPELQNEAMDFVRFLRAKSEKEVSESKTSENIVNILTRIAERGNLAGIEDPVKWQQGIRKDRELPGRS
jgi:hypothetical protein